MNYISDKACKLAASLFEYSFKELSLLKMLGSKIQFIELRADINGHYPDYESIRNSNPAKLIYSLRSQSEGGAYLGTNEERTQLLIEASRHCDLVELEGARDLTPEIINIIPHEKRLISWHGDSCSVSDLEKRYNTYAQVEAAFYRFVPKADKAADGLIPLLFLKRIKRSDVISYAAGAIGQWTQIIAPYLGATIAFGIPSQNNNWPDIFTIEQLIEDYNLPNLVPFQSLYGIVGNPVFRSRSPKMHNNVYRRLGIEALYLPFQVSDFDDFWTGLVENPEIANLGFSFKGFTVVSPFKEKAVDYSQKAQTSIILEANACNVLTKQSGEWELGTTDFFGLESAIAAMGLDMAGLKVAIIGCGGAGRTMAAGLKLNGADVLLVNRSVTRAHKAARLLQLPFRLLADFSPYDFDLVINATPVGRLEEEAPFDLEKLEPRTAVIDLTYSKRMTKLVKHCYLNGNKVTSGRNILLFQVLQQFKLLSGEEMPLPLARILSGVNEENKLLTELKDKNGIKKQHLVAIDEQRRVMGRG